MKRYAMGFSRGGPAMFEQPDGAYVRWTDVASRLTICGHAGGGPAVLDADLVGCAQPIDNPADVFRCTDCGVPFHRQCAVKHFTEDTPEHASKRVDEQIRRMDAKAAAGVTVDRHQTFSQQTPVDESKAE